MRKTKRVGIVGLGKMGSRIAGRLLKQGYSVTAADLDPKAVENIKKRGAVGVRTLKEVADSLAKPRLILLLIPAGRKVDAAIKALSPHILKGDIIADLGNSFYRDSQIRARSLKKKGVSFLDVGVSGGTEGAKKGACLMIGGDKRAFEKSRWIFEALSRQGSYKYLGKSGAGHLAKGFHNLAEYGFLQSLAETLDCLQAISNKERIGLTIQGACEIWNKGSIVESRITKDLETALKHNHGLKGISGSVSGQCQKEMQSLIGLIKDYDLKAPSCKAAVNARLGSRKRPSRTGRIINGIRNIFGGHREWKQR